MSDFVIAMGPIVFLWSVPLLPLLYTALAATVEAAVSVARPTPQPPRTAATTASGASSWMA